MMAELPKARVVEFLGAVPPGDIRCLLARIGLGGRRREADPDPVGRGAGAVEGAPARFVDRVPCQRLSFSEEFSSSSRPLPRKSISGMMDWGLNTTR